MAPCISRRRFLQCTGALAASLVVSSGLDARLHAHLHAQSHVQEAALAAQPPNVLLILVDDLGWGDLRCTGHPYVQTPSLDRLAQQSTTFRQFYVAAPVCSPSRAACLTGQFPARYRILTALGDAAFNAAVGQADWLDPQAPSVCRAFQSAGYVTGLIGKWHLGHVAGAPPPAAYSIDEARTCISVDPLWDEQDGQDPVFRARSTEIMVDEAIQFIQSHPNQPWFLNLWTLAVHSVLDPAQEELARYAGLAVNPDAFTGDMPDYLRAVPEVDSKMRVYCAAVTALDRALGRLLAYLDSSGLAGNTIVVFASDNGPDSWTTPGADNAGVGSPGNLRGRKATLYEGGIRVPLLVRWPGRIPAGRVNTAAVVGAVDLLPTLCRLAGVPLPVGYVADGEDASAAWRGAAWTRRRSLYWVFGGAAIRAGRYKLLIEGQSAHLYDIVANPGEQTDLVQRQPWLAKALADELLAWLRTLPISVAQEAAVQEASLAGLERAGAALYLPLVQE